MSLRPEWRLSLRTKFEMKYKRPRVSVFPVSCPADKNGNLISSQPVEACEGFPIETR